MKTAFVLTPAQEQVDLATVLKITEEVVPMEKVTVIVMVELDKMLTKIVSLSCRPLLIQLMLQNTLSPQ